MGEIAPEEQFLPFSTIFYYLMLDFYIKTGIRFSLRDTQQTRNVIVTFSIGFKLVTLNLTFGKRLANVYVLCRHILMCNEIR